MNAVYVSPYGKLEGLPARLDEFTSRLRKDRSYPWLGTGIIQDIELMRKFLNLREYGEFLRAKGGGDLGPIGDEIIEACDLNEDAERLEQSIDERLGVPENQPYDVALERAEKQAESLVRIRETLVAAGALAEDDTDTDVAMLVEMLLS